VKTGVFSGFAENHIYKHLQDLSLQPIKYAYFGKF